MFRQSKAIFLKSAHELEIIRQNGVILGKVHAEVCKLVKPGVNTSFLDTIAEEFIRDNGGVPSFKGYNNFPASLCISVNDVVVHGIPSKQELQDGDIVSIDCGVYKEGYHADSAYTYVVGKVKPEILKLLRITKESLYKGIEKAIEGNRVGDIAHAIQSYCEANKYTVVRELVGHGVGKNLHEAPEVPNYGKRNEGQKLLSGMVIAIEPMINLGRRDVVQENDGWTIRTKDNRPSAHFEHTVAIQKGKAEILTTFEYIEAVEKEKTLPSQVFN